MKNHMKLKSIINVVYYVPVNQKYFDKWEYYQVDLKMLKDVHENVLVAKTFKEFIKIIFSKKIDLVYYWWWHSSLVVILISKLINIPTYGTGAVHMYDESGALDFYKKTSCFVLQIEYLGEYLTKFYLSQRVNPGKLRLMQKLKIT